MRPFVVTALTLVVAAVALVGLLWLGQRRLIYLPSGDVPAVEVVLPGASEVSLRADDGVELAAWHVPAPRGGATVLFAPGNAGNRGARAPFAAALRQRGLGVLLLDYRGYGGNPGGPSEEGLALDVRAARRHLLDEQGVAPTDLVYFGESIGAAVVAELAVEHPPAALVLRSPFASLREVAAVHYPVLPAGLLLRDRFDVVEHVTAVRVPTVVILGTRDGIVPPEQSRAVARAAGGPVEVVEVAGADHNDRSLLDGDPVVDAVVTVAARR